MAAGLTLNVGVATDVGRVREHNEDSAFAQAGGLSLIHISQPTRPD